MLYVSGSVYPHLGRKTYSSVLVLQRLARVTILTGLWHYHDVLSYLPKQLLGLPYLSQTRHEDCFHGGLCTFCYSYYRDRRLDVATHISSLIV